MTRTLPDGVHDSPEGYENLTRIGQGGSAVVYRGLDTRFDRIVALKILGSDSLDERQLRRFNAECLATGRVSSHPNIVTVYDAGITSGHRPWMAMEYCSGGSLAQKLARLGPLPVAEVISIGARLCGALAAAHEAGILHRDVKPHNVLVTSYGEPALADFGIATVRTEAGTATETAAFTVVHAAPEILEGRTGTAAADVYSLGSTLYTLLAGQAPFAREASIGLAPLVSRILRGDPPVIARPGVPPELEQLLRRSMAAHPRDRPASAAELGEHFADLGRRMVIDQPATGPLPPAGSPAVPPMSARPLLVILGGVLGALLATFLIWGSGFHGPGPDGTQPDAVVSTDSRTGGGAPPAAAQQYVPRDLVATQGHNKGELIVTWRMPIRPDVVATVVYEVAGTARARAIVNYDSRSKGPPVTTLHGLPRSQRVCLSAAHVVSVNDTVSNAVSEPVCAVPR